MASVNQLILHVGMPKTASSALQTFLYEHREDLELQGCTYPDDDVQSVLPKHQSLVEGLLSNNQSSLQAHCMKTKFSQMILSTEGLTNHLYDFDKTALETFRDVTREFDLRVFMILRDPEEWCRSYYAQAVLNPPFYAVNFYATHLTFEEFIQHPRVAMLTDHETLKCHVAAAYAASEIVAVDLDDDWFGMFCKSFNLEFDKCRVPQRVNESPPAWTIELMRQINSFKVPEMERRAWMAVLQKYVQSNHVGLRNSASAFSKVADITVDPALLEKLRVTENGEFGLTQDDIGGFSSFLDAASLQSHAP